MRALFLSPLLALFFALSSFCTLSYAADAPVVFICEHGTAKSVIAALYFNKIAEQRGLPYRAVSRGIKVETELQAATQQGLSQDGIATKDFVASSITAELAHNARRVVTIGLENPPDFVKHSKPLEWNNVPAVSKGYPRARDDMVQKIDALLLELANGTAKHSGNE